MTAFAPSPFQTAIFDAIRGTNDSLCVAAVAGSGKTTTIVRALDFLPKGKSVIMLAFNKSIATELGTKVPRGVECKTCHSVGFAAWRNFLGRRQRCRVEAKKTWKILDQMARDGDIDRKDVSMYGSFVNKVVGLAKHAGMGTDLCEDTPETWDALVSHHDVTLGSAHADFGFAMDLCGRVLRRSQRQKYEIDFDDMLYMPVFYGANFKRYDVVFIDEAQDTNVVQGAMLEAMLKVNGRLILVGDERQAIYGFRGADSEAMERLSSGFDCRSLPLSVSYRCARAIVDEAKRIAPEIESWDDAAEGTVDSVDRYTGDTFSHHDAILCRNTAPLVSMAYGLIGRGVGVRFLGRDIGQGLISLIRKLDAPNIDALEINLDTWQTRETDKAKRKRQDSRIQSIEDKAACLRVFIQNLAETRRTISALIDAIETLFAEKSGQLLTLCTIHKSKGMEWARVFILDRGLMPSKYATQPWMRVQESNLEYVAITRAKRHLTYIYSDAWGVDPAKLDKGGLSLD
jgi:superfamily I DNA/RNA helicase